jgi:Major Facilitator Superfamily
LTVLMVMGMATKRLGLGSTRRTTYYEPFDVARTFATIVHPPPRHRCLGVRQRELPGRRGLAPDPPALHGNAGMATDLGRRRCVLPTMLPLTLALRRRAPVSRGPLSTTVAGTEAGRRHVAPGRLQALLMVAGMACCVAMSMPQVHIVAYASDLGHGVAHGAEMLSSMLGMGVFSRLVSGWIADRVGGVPTLLLGSALQCLVLALYLPFDGLVSLYVVSALFGLAQGGIVPSYAVIVREYFAPQEAGARIGGVVMATIFGMALGGWLSGAIFDLTGSYRLAFVNGIVWNLLNLAIALWLLGQPRRIAALA